MGETRKDVDQKRTLTAPQVTERCGVTPKTVHRWIRAGYFPGATKGLGRTSRYHIPEDKVEAFIAQMSRGLREQWEREHPQAGDKARGAGRRPDRPRERAAPAPLAEMLRQLEGQDGRAQFALIVEDDADAGQIFELTLRAAWFDPLAVHSGSAALAPMVAMVPDLVVLDLHMPDVPGTEVLRRMRSHPKLAQVPVIVATAYPEMAAGIQDTADGSTEASAELSRARAEVLVLIKPVRYDMLQDRAAELARP